MAASRFEALYPKADVADQAHLDRNHPTTVTRYSAEKGLLVNRDDLVAGYVKSVVRAGKGAMPRLTAVDVTDSELELIAAYLDGGTE